MIDASELVRGMVVRLEARSTASSKTKRKLLPQS